MESHNASFLVDLNHTEFAGLFPGNGDRRHRHFRLLCDVKIDHAGDTHAVDVIATEDGHQVRIGLLDEVDVLKNGVGRSQIPGFILRTHLCRHVDDEVAFQHSAELPSFAQVLQQRLAAELGEHIDRVNAGIHEIAEYKIDDPVFASEWNRRLGALARQRRKSGSFSPGQHNA